MTGCSYCESIDYPVSPTWMACGHQPTVTHPRGVDWRRVAPETSDIGYLAQQIDRLVDALATSAERNSSRRSYVPPSEKAHPESTFKPAIKAPRTTHQFQDEL